jgi:hypothetical protein
VFSHVSLAMDLNLIAPLVLQDLLKLAGNAKEILMLALK